MILSDLSIRRPVFAWMVMLALILFGFIGFSRMGISLMPDVDFPMISVNINYSGASPETMETDVADFVENAVMGVEGVKTVTSSLRQGSAHISIEFELSKNIDIALQEVQTKIAQAQRLLPKEYHPPVITKTNPEDQPIIWLSLTSSGVDTREVMSYVSNYLNGKFATVSGVGNILLGGYINPALRVSVRKGDLAKYQMTVQDVLSTVQNEHVELPAGYVRDEKETHTVRVLGEAKTESDFKEIFMNSRGGQPNYSPIRIIQIADIRDGLADTERLARSNGVPAVGIGIVKQRGTNAVEVANAVIKRVNEIKKELPKGMELSVRVNNATYIEDAVNELKFTLLLSALLTGLVCWLFLGSWSATFNIWLAIPTSIIGTFLFTNFFGFTLNTFTLIALSLAVGIVVDDAIMVLENIVRHQEKGEERIKAAILGSREITFAAMAASIAIVAIFLPVAFMKGIIGKYFFQFGVTITVAVLISLFEALTLTPMRASQFVSGGKRNNRFTKAIDDSFNSLRVIYRISLEWALERRIAVILFSIIFFVVTFTVGQQLRSELVPPQDQSLYTIRVQAPAWASLSFTDGKVKEIEAILMKRPEVLGCFTTVGGYGGSGVQNMANINVTLKPKGKRGTDPAAHHPLSQGESMRAVRSILKKLPDLKIGVQDPSIRGFASTSSYGVEFSIRGPDRDMLGKFTQQMMDELDKSGLMTDLNSNYLPGMTEYEVIPGRDLAEKHGVSYYALAQTVSVLVGGLKSGTFERAGHRYDIVVKMKGEALRKEDILRDVFIRNNRGELIQISELVRIEEKPALQTIYRADRERATTVQGNLAAGQSQDKVINMINETAVRILPEGYRIVFSGNSQAYAESFSSLIFALILGIAVAYMVLGSQFNSFIDPVIVLLALPFSFSGAFLAMYVTGQSLNIFSMIGFILLMGIVKKNSILLVDFTNKQRENGLSIREALLVACPIRLRPILMTTTATMAGALPAAIAFGPGSETRAPMAIAIIGGLFVSTLLTLFVIPCVYSLIGHKHERSLDLGDIDK